MGCRTKETDGAIKKRGFPDRGASVAAHFLRLSPYRRDGLGLLQYSSLITPGMRGVAKKLMEGFNERRVAIQVRCDAYCSVWQLLM